MTPQPTPRPFTTQVTLTVLALGFSVLAIATGFGLYAMNRADEDALDRQKTFVTSGLKDAEAEVAREQESITIWDDAVTFAKAHDDQWMRENLGEWMNSYYGHDRIYVLDEQNRPVHAMIDGKTVPPARYADDEAVVAPKVAALRSLMADIEANQPEDPPKRVVEDLVSIAGKPAIISVMPIVPNSDRVAQEPGSEYLHVTTKYVDDEIVGAIAKQYLLKDVHIGSLLTAPAAASVPLIDSRGVILGYVGWTADRPGLALVLQTAPVFGLGILLGAGVLVFLLRRLRRASSALQTSQDEAQFLAFHDVLTGLPNRALFEDRLKRAFVSARRDRSRVALLYIDLDRFKNVNDTLGHPAGDELVRQAARRLETRIREIDTVARLGGDEFAVILADVRNVAAAEDVAEKLREDVSRPFVLMGDQVFIGASIGIALSWESDGPEELLRKADIALYEAKRAGRGRSQVFAGDMDELIARRRLIESDLRAALSGDKELKLLYQPVYAADARVVLGAEALVRWEHPVHGALSPAHFISIAEERGMIGALGMWMIGAAARFAATTDLPWVSINVSPLQLRDETFAPGLLQLLAAAGLAANRLRIEVAESVLIEDNAAARTVLAALRAAGVGVVLDHFGAGHCSLAHLTRRAVDKLKIDRSFVRQLGAGVEANAIVEAITHLARAADLSVAAEGVETEEQRFIAAAMGCNEMQGLLLSAPLPEQELRALLADDGSTARQAAN